MTPSFLIAGAAGMLGTALQRVIANRRERMMAPAEREFDITDVADVSRVVSEFVADLEHVSQGVLVNAAAYTNVERAEDEPDVAYCVNKAGAGILAAVAKEVGLRFVHVSTDFVFDGTKNGAYSEADSTNPLSVYGASKLAGEKAVAASNPDALVVRTAWAFGPNGTNFPVKILAAAREGRALAVVADEFGCPTYTVDLAAGILGLLDADAEPGVYHLAGDGAVSRYDFALEILRLAEIDVPVARAHAADFPSKARRPVNSALDCSKAAAIGVRMPAWTDGLARFVDETSST